MGSIELKVLGPFELILNGSVVPVPGQKDRALLAYLAIGGSEHRREKLAGLLWGESPDARARDSLKHSLARLSAALVPAGPILSTSRNSVSVDLDAIRVDAIEVLKLAESSRLDLLDQALSLYRGALLEDLSLDETGFDAWLRAERQQLSQSADYAAGRLLAHFGENGSADEAAEIARRVLTVDPENDRACRLLMRALAESGDTAQALKCYRDFVARLEQRLNIPPDSETAALFREIRDGRATGRRVGRENMKSATTQLGSEQSETNTRPTLAVLAFKSLSQEAAYFVDGIVEEITTALSRNRGIVMISHLSSFALRDRQADVREIGRTLGARYLVQGSLQQSVERVRINVSLLDAQAGTLLWSEAFQEAMTDIFELQDRIAARVAGTLLPKLEAAEIARVSQKPTESLDAYDYYLRGLAEMHRWSEAPCARALVHFSDATDLDPGFAVAHAMKVRCYSQRKASRWIRDPEAELAETEECLRLSRLAADLAPDDALVLAVAGLGIGYIPGQPEQGVRLTERSLKLNPNLTWGWVFSGWMHVWLGLGETAIEHFARAMRLSPQDPQFMMMQAGTAFGHFLAGRAREAADWAEAAVLANPNVWLTRCALAASRAAGGDLDGAKAAMAEVLRMDPTFRVSNLFSVFPIRDETNRAVWVDALKRAGLPD